MSEMNFETWVKELADAIRTKKGTSDKIKALDYKQEILSIETGASGEPIIIETEEDFNALLENATQEDDEKIYLYNDNLYKLNYNETTTIRTLEIVANGEYDVALYDKVNVQVQSESSGATIEVLGASPIPNDGTFVESVMFNTSLSDDEVKSILDGLTYTMLSALGQEVNIILHSIEEVGDVETLIGVVKFGEGMYVLMDYLNEVVFWHNIPDLESEFGSVGWGQFTNPYPITGTMQKGAFLEAPIGIENNLLTNLMYIQEEAKSKTLSGTYDGSSIYVIENGVVDVETLIDEGKIPLKVNVDVDKSSTLNYLALNVGYPILENQTLSKVYINTKRDASKLLNIAKELPYTFYVSNLVAYGYLVAQNSSDSKWLAILKIENSYGQTYYQLQTSDDKVLWIGAIIPQEDGTIQEGGQWGGIDDEGSYSELELNWVVAKTGGYNEWLSDYISSVTFGEFDRTKKIQSGVYQGQRIEISENGLVDLSDLYDEQKMPTSVNVNVASSGEDMMQTKVDLTNSCAYLLYKSEISNVDFISNLDTSNATSMQYMFSNCSKITTIPPLDTSNATNMIYMFNSCESLTTIPQLNTSNVTSMQYMFYGCKNLTSIPQLNTSNVTSMEYMLRNCSSLTTIPLLDTSKVTNMNYMFQYCSNLTSIPQLNTSNATSMQYMFSNCSKITTIPPLDTSNATSMQYMFSNCSKITTIPPLDTSNATNMSNMFNGCSNLTTIPLLDMRSVTNTNSMFYLCTNLTNLTLKNIKVKLQIGSGTSYGHLLTLESLLNTCQECINVNNSRTLTIGTANLEKLASVYVKLTNAPEEDETLPKLPMVQCESGDEGAMTIQDYMALKNWTLA